MKKGLLIVGLCVLVLLPVLLYGGIVIANNGVADSVERDLKNTPLPQDTVFLDSIALAGKLTGNGNGMQYMGSILVTGDLTEKELYDYYSQTFQYVEVRKQESPKIDFINTDRYSFELFADSEQYDQYSITCWGSPEDYGIGGIASALLNLDIRGH